MPQRFFDPASALRDLLKELHTRGGPHFGERSWFYALAIIEERDVMRQVRARNEELFPNGHEVRPLYSPDDDPHRLIFLGYAVPMAEPAREVDQMYEARSHAGEVIYRVRHAEKIKAYNREYRRKNHEKFLAWQRDYRMANADRLNAAKRAKRRAAAQSNG
jgi:hypothetical protein